MEYPIKERPKVEYVEYHGVKMANVSTLDVFRLERYIDYLESEIAKTTNTSKNNNELGIGDVSGSALLNELLAAQQEIINSPIRFGIDEEAVKRIFKKYGVDYFPF